MTLQDLQTVILAGGLGTRLQSVIQHEPKALASIAGRPFIDWMLERLTKSGIKRVVLCTGYLASMLRDHIGDGHRWNLRVVYSEEPEPLGTAGALKYALPAIDSNPILVLNGDSWCDCDLAAFFDWHIKRRARASLVVTRVDDCARFGTVEFDAESRIQRFSEKAGKPLDGWINAGIYLVDRSLISPIEDGRMVSLERDVLPGLIGDAVFAFRASGPFVDIGTPESYFMSQTFLPQIIVAKNTI